MGLTENEVGKDNYEYTGVLNGKTVILLVDASGDPKNYKGDVFKYIVDDPETNGIIYSGHTGMGGSLAFALDQAPETDILIAGTKFIGCLSCASASAYAGEITKRFPGSHGIFTTTASDNTADVPALQIIIDGLTKDQDWPTIHNRVKKATARSQDKVEYLFPHEIERRLDFVNYNVGGRTASGLIYIPASDTILLQDFESFDFQFGNIDITRVVSNKVTQVIQKVAYFFKWNDVLKTFHDRIDPSGFKISSTDEQNAIFVEETLGDDGKPRYKVSINIGYRNSSKAVLVLLVLYELNEYFSKKINKDGKLTAFDQLRGLQMTAEFVKTHNKEHLFEFFLRKLKLNPQDFPLDLLDKTLDTNLEGDRVKAIRQLLKDNKIKSEDLKKAGLLSVATLFHWNQVFDVMLADSDLNYLSPNTDELLAINQPLNEQIGALITHSPIKNGIRYLSAASNLTHLGLLFSNRYKPSIWSFLTLPVVGFVEGWWILGSTVMSRGPPWLMPAVFTVFFLIHLGMRIGLWMKGRISGRYVLIGLFSDLFVLTIYAFASPTLFNTTISIWIPIGIHMLVDFIWLKKDILKVERMPSLSEFKVGQYLAEKSSFGQAIREVKNKNQDSTTEPFGYPPNVAHVENIEEISLEKIEPGQPADHPEREANIASLAEQVGMDPSDVEAAYDTMVYDMVQRSLNETFFPSGIIQVDFQFFDISYDRFVIAKGILDLSAWLNIKITITHDKVIVERKNKSPEEYDLGLGTHYPKVKTKNGDKDLDRFLKEDLGLKINGNLDEILNSIETGGIFIQSKRGGSSSGYRIGKRAEISFVDSGDLASTGIASDENALQESIFGYHYHPVILKPDGHLSPGDEHLLKTRYKVKKKPVVEIVVSEAKDSPFSDIPYSHRTKHVLLPITSKHLRVRLLGILYIYEEDNSSRPVHNSIIEKLRDFVQLDNETMRERANIDIFAKEALEPMHHLSRDRLMSSLREEPTHTHEFLFQLAPTDGLAKDIWREFELEKEYQQYFENDDEFWDSELSFYEIYQKLKSIKEESDRLGSGGSNITYLAFLFSDKYKPSALSFLTLPVVGFVEGWGILGSTVMSRGPPWLMPAVFTVFFLIHLGMRIGLWLKGRISGKSVIFGVFSDLFVLTVYALASPTFFDTPLSIWIPIGIHLLVDSGWIGFDIRLTKKTNQKGAQAFDKGELNQVVVEAINRDKQRILEKHSSLPRLSLEEAINHFKNPETPIGWILKINNDIEVKQLQDVGFGNLDFEVGLFRFRGTNQWIAIKVWLTL